MTSVTVPINDPGSFIEGESFDMESYQRYRPIYPQQFYNDLYKYHGSKRGAGFFTVHDVGAGVGLVAEKLSEKFLSVIVSEPNSRYLEIARKRLYPDGEDDFNDYKYRFLNESAEDSSVESETVDCVVISGAIQWTNIDLAITQFRRQLKVNGTLCIVHSGFCRILDAGRTAGKAAETWVAMGQDFADEKGFNEYNKYLDPREARAFHVLLTNFHLIKLPSQAWGSIRRRMLNTFNGSYKPFILPKKGVEIRQEDMKVDNSIITYAEGLEGWMRERCDLAWFKNYWLSFMSGRKLADDQKRWAALEWELRKAGSTVTVTFPTLQIFATRKESGFEGPLHGEQQIPKAVTGSGLVQATAPTSQIHRKRIYRSDNAVNDESSTKLVQDASPTKRISQQGNPRGRKCSNM